jgi:alpha-L-fucosidase
MLQRANRVVNNTFFIIIAIQFILVGSQSICKGSAVNGGESVILQAGEIEEKIGTKDHVLPHPRQIRWQERELTAFVHFTVNTFTDREWGDGGEKPTIFNPSELDVKQWVDVFKKAGMKMVIITAKHHDGFCLWPSKFTEHSVKNSPYRNGKGDIVGELAKACREAGLELGIYLSPWDRNHADYGTDEYLIYFRKQLRELLTEYGDIAEVWFDGANGGTGYYGGANENRKIDRRTYYDWPTTRAMVRQLQPNACMFSDAGPDCRWVGNENGFAGETCFSMLRCDEFYPGSPNYRQLTQGHIDGTHWVPAECDVSIRPGWFYHAAQDDRIKSLEHLLDIYYGSVGRNGQLLLNIPPDRRGLIHENDVKRLEEFRKVLDRTFDENFAAGTRVIASNTRGLKKMYGPSNLTDDSTETIWATDNGVTTAELVFDLGKKKTFNVIMVQEYIKKGQRIQKFEVEAWDGKRWKKIADETTIGYKRLLRIGDVTAAKVRLKITKATDCPILSNFGLYRMPVRLSEPGITRNRQGMVNIRCQSPGPAIRYTLDGTLPTMASNEYTTPFPLPKGGLVKARAFIAAAGEKSSIVQARFDVCKAKWKVVFVDDYVSGFEAEKAIDGNPSTMWHTKWQGDLKSHPHEIQVDLGETLELAGFTYAPRSDGNISGIVNRYDLYTSMDGRDWIKRVDSREFSNIKNNPVKQSVNFGQTIKAKFIRFVSLSEVAGDSWVSMSELGVITGK